MENETLLITTPFQGATVITFNRPHTLNALDLATMLAFKNVINALQNDTSLKVVILTGAGEKAFCSGGDLTELRQKPSAKEGLEMISLMGDALLALERLPIPVIAAINGYALGGGSEIALACDIRLVDDHAKMGFVQINMALTAGWGAGQRLLRLVGYSKAMELFLSGDELNASQLLAMGLANRLTSYGQAFSEALKLAESIANRPPDVVKGIKRLLQAGLHQPYEQALMTERAIFPPLWESQAHTDAVENFFARQAIKSQNKPD